MRVAYINSPLEFTNSGVLRLDYPESSQAFFLFVCLFSSKRKQCLAIDGKLWQRQQFFAAASSPGKGGRRMQLRQSQRTTRLRRFCKARLRRAYAAEILQLQGTAFVQKLPIAPAVTFRLR